MKERDVVILGLIFCVIGLFVIVASFLSDPPMSHFERLYFAQVVKSFEPSAMSGLPASEQRKIFKASLRDPTIRKDFEALWSDMQDKNGLQELFVVSALRDAVRRFDERKIGD